MSTEPETENKCIAKKSHLSIKKHYDIEQLASEYLKDPDIYLQEFMEKFRRIMKFDLTTSIITSANVKIYDDIVINKKGRKKSPTEDQFV